MASDPLDVADARVVKALEGGGWETRDDYPYPDGEPKCWVERGTTDAGTWERFTDTPLTYVEACAIVRLLEVASDVKVFYEALSFYADPETYFAISMFPDRPCGEFADDFDECEHPDGGTWVKPGKRAREVRARFDAGSSS